MPLRQGHHNRFNNTLSILAVTFSCALEGLVKCKPEAGMRDGDIRA